MNFILKTQFRFPLSSSVRIFYNKVINGSTNMWMDHLHTTEGKRKIRFTYLFDPVCEGVKG